MLLFFASPEQHVAGDHTPLVREKSLCCLDPAGFYMRLGTIRIEKSFWKFIPGRQGPWRPRKEVVRAHAKAHTLNSTVACSDRRSLSKTRTSRSNCGTSHMFLGLRTERRSFYSYILACRPTSEPGSHAVFQASRGKRRELRAFPVSKQLHPGVLLLLLSLWLCPALHYVDPHTI